MTKNMNDSQVLEHMCRACMRKDQTFHLLCDEPQDKFLTIYEMLAATIPQVAIHSNDELPKKICEACLNTLISVHEFQQMCIASDTYMRTLLDSNRLARHISINNIKEKQEGIKRIALAQETEKLDILHVTQDLHQSPRYVKVETYDEEAKESVILEPTCYQEIDAMSLNKKEVCMKFEANDMEMRECDVMTAIRSGGVLLESREVCNDDSIAIVLDSYEDSDQCENNVVASSKSCAVDDTNKNLEWSDADNCIRIYQKNSPSNISNTEQQTPSTSGVANEPVVYGIEKPYSSSHLQYNFPCLYCDAMFPAESNLKIHTLVHDEARPLVCEICSFRYKTRLGLLHHKKTHKMTPPGGFKCRKCPRRFEKRISLSSHMKTHCGNENPNFMHGNKIDSTDIILEPSLGDDNKDRKKSKSNVSKAEQQQPRTSSNSYETNSRKIEKPNSNSRLQYRYFCTQCDAVFSDNYKLNQHSHLHDETRPFVCRICNYRFKNVKSWRQHKDAHKMTPPGGFKCPNCPRRFEKKFSLSSHKRTHRECNFCLQKFEKLTSLTDHLRQYKSHKFIHEDNNDNTAINLEQSCSDDNESYSEWNDDDCSGYQKKSTSNISKAEQQQPSTSSVTNETELYQIESSDLQYKFPCPHCEAVFASKYTLKQHSHLHDKTRLFVCKVCNFRFETYKNLTSHKKAHKITPPDGFKCPKCPRRFEKQMSIVSHMKTHRENTFKCDLCLKKFVKLTSLTDHLRKHKCQKFMHEIGKDNAEAYSEWIIGDDN